MDRFAHGDPAWRLLLLLGFASDLSYRHGAGGGGESCQVPSQSQWWAWSPLLTAPVGPLQQMLVREPGVLMCPVVECSSGLSVQGPGFHTGLSVRALTPRTAGALPAPRGECKVLVWTLPPHHHVFMHVCCGDCVAGLLFEEHV